MRSLIKLRGRVFTDPPNIVPSAPGGPNYPSPYGPPDSLDELLEGPPLPKSYAEGSAGRHRQILTTVEVVVMCAPLLKFVRIVNVLVVVQ
ncbi:hypothetical protein V502_03108 [Pseudogymnoascus sp. VKM F-4520 (FW-2644)]|nr:hypothetical protein V502_03108 [Pseudogymnoascus sp. VKM F-4520 (FW-2644)]